VVYLADCLLQQIEPFLQGKKRLLFVVARDRDNYFIEKFSGPLDHVEMTIGDRIEASGVNRTSHAAENQSSSLKIKFALVGTRWVHLPNDARSGRLIAWLHDESVQL